MIHIEKKEYYKSGHLEWHTFVDENGWICGEYRRYHENGQLHWHYLMFGCFHHGEVKMINTDGTLVHHYLMDGKNKHLASVIRHGKASSHSESQLIQNAKERGLPLLSDLPKTEAELTLWNLKYPNMPCLPISTK